MNLVAKTSMKSNLDPPPLRRQFGFALALSLAAAPSVSHAFILADTPHDPYASFISRLLLLSVDDSAARRRLSAERVHRELNALGGCPNVNDACSTVSGSVSALNSCTGSGSGASYIGSYCNYTQVIPGFNERYSPSFNGTCLAYGVAGLNNVRNTAWLWGILENSRETKPHLRS